MVVRKEMLAVLDACKAADFVVFVLSANQEVDEFGESLIRSIEAQGVSNAFTVIQVCLGIELGRSPGVLTEDIAPQRRREEEGWDQEVVAQLHLAFLPDNREGVRSRVDAGGAESYTLDMYDESQGCALEGRPSVCGCGRGFVPRRYVGCRGCNSRARVEGGSISSYPGLWRFPD